MTRGLILFREALGSTWRTDSPFLLCAYHRDVFPPAGKETLGPPSSALRGRTLGSDFSGKDGFSMYHGTEVSGFPRHPHRGFETVTLAKMGYLDHADSLGCGGRFGGGDGQWMTAGRGIEHSEMAPCLRNDAVNDTEVFQLWLNLPRSSKLCDPDFKMLWRHDLPKIKTNDATLTLICGHLAGFPEKPPSPPVNSYAADSANSVLILLVALENGASYTVPPGPPSVHRNVYFFEGNACIIGDELFKEKSRIKVKSDEACTITNPSSSGNTRGSSTVMILQGKAIDEPVVQHGPFVGNSREDILQAFHDYENRQFGNWPWPKDDPTHDPSAPRFASYPDGSREEFPL